VVPTGFQGVFVSRKDPPEFHQQTRAALKKLDSKPAGATVLQQLAALNEMNPKKMVIIKKATPEICSDQSMPAFDRPRSVFPLTSSSVCLPKRTSDPFVPYVAGKGADKTIIEFNPSGGMKFEAGRNNWKQDDRLGFINLGHELVHASHYLHGVQYREFTDNPGLDSDTGAAEEELRTTGVGPWRDEYPSDNAIRREHGENEREDYAGNRGTRLSPPPEINSTHTKDRLQELGAVYGRPLGRPDPKKD